MPSAVTQQDANRFDLMREVIRVQKRADCMKACQSANLGMPFYPFLRYLFGWVDDHVIVLEVGE
jgi:hypothetical protein